jgi:hypothetical protein
MICWPGQLRNPRKPPATSNNGAINRIDVASPPERRRGDQSHAVPDAPKLDEIEVYGVGPFGYRTPDGDRGTGADDFRSS